MATNEALFSVTGYVATQPKAESTKSGTAALTFRLAWTPRELSRATGEWCDLPSSFVTVTCYGKVAENARFCLHKGEPIVLRGTLRVREWLDQNGGRRHSVDVKAEYIGHDMAKGVTLYTKRQHRTEPTADEYERSQANGRNPLPGDVAAHNGVGDLQSAASHLGESDPGGADIARAGVAEEMPDEPADSEVEDSDVEDSDVEETGVLNTGVVNNGVEDSGVSTRPGSDDSAAPGEAAELAESRPGVRAGGRGRMKVRAPEGAGV
ncbi:MAG: single-stranded DNA-binding protein [Actinobacteria bacterium]|nr:single-stranded DNA-binding protein [Actinomycetota bacterium]